MTREGREGREKEDKKRKKSVHLQRRAWGFLLFLRKEAHGPRAWEWWCGGKQGILTIIVLPESRHEPLSFHPFIYMHMHI
jgi:hypothetical protein